MGEEEIIEILEDRDMFIDTLYENYRQSTVKPFDKAIQGLLDLYNKEKEKNKKQSVAITEYKELLEQANNKVDELQNTDLAIVYMTGFYDGENKWKNKIKVERGKYEIMYENLPINPKEHPHSKIEYQIVIGILQDLLEEDNK